jgi:hypothetical protein
MAKHCNKKQMPVIWHNAESTVVLYVGFTRSLIF